MGGGHAGALQPAETFHRLRRPRYYRADSAIADRYAHRLHDRAGARIWHALSTHGHVTAAEPNHHRKNSALSRDLDSPYSFHHRGRWLAFSCSVPSVPHAGSDLFALSALL